MKHKQKHKIVIWMCEKCDHINYREVPFKLVINDDTCDHCHKYVHEPCLEMVSKTKLD